MDVRTSKGIKSAFVRFEPADSTIRGHKAKNDHRNIILEMPPKISSWPLYLKCRE